MTRLDVDDLREFAGLDGPFFTVAVPTPSQLDDSTHRMSVEWSNARRQLDDRWTEPELAEVDAVIEQLPHDGGAALVVMHSATGATHAEFIDEPVSRPYVSEGDAPVLSLLIEARQRTLPHLVIETDRTGADITAFDGGRLLAVEQVAGDTEHIHRGHPGGWSQRRFQQRAENTWERNADDVADAATELADQVGAVRIFVAGEVRAQTLVVEAVSAKSQIPVVALAAGDPDGIADEVVRLLSSHVAAEVTELADQVKSRLGTGGATVDPAEVLRWLSEGKVKTLLVHDDLDGEVDETTTDQSIGGLPAGTRLVDAAILAGLRSGADIVVVPRLAAMEGPIAALARW